MKLNMSKGTPGFAFMGELFALLRDYGTPEDRDEYWQELISKAETIVNRYDKYPEIKEISDHMTRGLLSGLDFRDKAMRKQESRHAG